MAVLSTAVTTFILCKGILHWDKAVDGMDVLRGIKAVIVKRNSQVLLHCGTHPFSIRYVYKITECC